MLIHTGDHISKFFTVGLNSSAKLCLAILGENTYLRYHIVFLLFLNSFRKFDNEQSATQIFDHGKVTAPIALRIVVACSFSSSAGCGIFERQFSTLKHQIMLVSCLNDGRIYVTLSAFLPVRFLFHCVHLLLSG